MKVCRLKPPASRAAGTPGASSNSPIVKAERLRPHAVDPCTDLSAFRGSNRASWKGRESRPG